ncbi:unnamed protein product [Ectocarpus sp. CCAP 1310/34]|nr:unnamed protein product [Ectocarpus sp. CCAP 1310/34]
MAGYPQIVAMCDRLLPEDVQRESSGVGGAAAGPTGAKRAAADAKRREDYKPRAREDNAHLKPKKNVSKNAGSVQETAAVAMHSMTSGLGLPPGGLSELFRPASEPAPAAAPSSRDILDAKTAKLAFSTPCSSLSKPPRKISKKPKQRRQAATARRWKW